MSIIRVSKVSKGYTSFDNRLLRDTRISYRALGVLVHLLSHVDGWNISAERLVRESGEKRDAILGALKELREAGYLVTMKGRDAGGKLTTINTLYDAPVGGWPTTTGSRPDTPTGVGFTDSGSTDSGSTDSGSTDSGKPNSFRSNIQEEPSKKNHLRKIIKGEETSPAGSDTTGVDTMARRRSSIPTDPMEIAYSLGQDSEGDGSQPTTHRRAWSLAGDFLTNVDPAYRFGLGTNQAGLSKKIKVWLDAGLSSEEFQQAVDMFIRDKSKHLVTCERKSAAPWVVFSWVFDSLITNIRSANKQAAEAKISAELSSEDRYETVREKYSGNTGGPSPWDA